MGVAALLAAATQGTNLDLPTWGLFAAAYVVLSFRSVEVNDRLYASSSVMPVLTAGVAFALSTDTSGELSPAFATALMASLGPFVPEDFRRRRFLQPAVNFGQLAVGGALAGFALDYLLRGIDAQDIQLGGGFLVIAFAGLAAALLYSAANVLLVRMAIGLTYGRREILPWSGMTSIVGSQALMGLLGGVLGAVLVVTSISLIPLILFVYVLGQLSVVAYAQLREAHESTLRGFVKTLETRDLYTRGHTERVAYFCQVIGEQLGFTGTQLERIRWAALIHDVGKLAVPVEVMKKRGRLEDEEYRKLRAATHRVDDLLSEVEFLAPMVEIASGCHPRLPLEDFGQIHHRHTTRPTLEQKVLAVADAFDAMTSTRSYRMATPQDVAIRVLREDQHPLYDNDIIDALVKGLRSLGERYGPPELAGSDDLRTVHA